MGRDVRWLRYKWVCLASSSSVIIGVFNYFKNEKPLNASYAFAYQPLRLWDYNWDKRDVSSLVKPCRHPEDPTSQERQQQKMAKVTPTATRYIFLLRHGQYEDWREEDKDRKLTPLGLEQAAILGQRLKDLKFGYSRLIHSSLTRAIETANIVRKFLPNDLTVECSELLCEGHPIPCEPPCGSWREEFKYYVDGPRIEAAFRKYFRRAEAKQKEDSFEIIVCHANVIRYFVCRLLQVPPEAWLRFSLYHCSVTWAAITPDGHVHLYAIGDAGFVPKDKLTFF